MKQWVILGLAIVAELIATTSLKASEGFSKPLPSFLVVVGYGVAFYCLALTLKVIPVGVAYAVWSGVGIVLVTLIAWLYFGQAPDLPAMVGIGFIIIGVLILNLFSKMSAH